MIRLLTRLIGAAVILVALFILLSPSIFKSLQTNLGNLSSQANASATVVSQLETPIAIVSTPIQAAATPTVVSATPGITPTSTNTGGSTALNYNNDSNNAFRRLISQFPDTGAAPPGRGSYDNYTFPRKY